MSQSRLQLLIHDLNTSSAVRGAVALFAPGLLAWLTFPLYVFTQQGLFHFAPGFFTLLMLSALGGIGPWYMTKSGRRFSIISYILIVASASLLVYLPATYSLTTCANLFCNSPTLASGEQIFLTASYLVVWLGMIKLSTLNRATDKS